MKLNNTLIATLADFIRNFSFESFWDNRYRFVRDMHPDKIYYWDDSMKTEYFKVSAWICKGENATKEDIETGITSLEKLIGKKIEPLEIGQKGICLDAKIIRVQAGNEVVLPEFNPEGYLGDIGLVLQKIEVYGNSKSRSKLKIGNSRLIELESGEFTYVTSINGLFIEFLPVTHMQNDVYDLTMLPRDGNFSSGLLVKSRLSGQQRIHENVLSFALVKDGYLYVTGENKLKVISGLIAKTEILPKPTEKPIYVKTQEDTVVVLCENGDMHSSEDIGVVRRVYSAGIDDSNNISVCHC